MYKIERNTHPTAVTWTVVRSEDGFAVATYASRKEALDRLQRLQQEAEGRAPYNK